MKMGSMNKLAVLFGFFGLYLGQFWLQYVPSFRVILLLLFIAFSFIIILKYCNREELILAFFSFTAVSCLILIGGIFGYLDPIKNISLMFFYFSILLGYFFSIEFKFFLKVISLFILINLAVMVYEFITMSYFLKPTSDSAFFLGRAKGFISYSKEAGSFILLFTLLFIKNLKSYWFMVVISFAVLTGSRLAMLIVLLAVVIEVCTRFKVRHLFSPLSLFISILSFIIVLYGAFLYANLEQSEVIINRLGGSVDIEHSSNRERINFWLRHLYIYESFNYLQYLFGSPGESVSKINNGAESAFINLITDGGLIALLIYTSAIIVMFFLTKPSVNTFLYFLLLILAMQLSRVNVGFLDATLFWGYFWFIIKNSIKSESKKENFVDNINPSNKVGTV